MATIALIKDALLALKDRTGSSLPAIKKWIEANNKKVSENRRSINKERQLACLNFLFFRDTQVEPNCRYGIGILLPLPPVGWRRGAEQFVPWVVGVLWTRLGTGPAISGPLRAEIPPRTLLVQNGRRILRGMCHAIFLPPSRPIQPTKLTQMTLLIPPILPILSNRSDHPCSPRSEGCPQEGSRVRRARQGQGLVQALPRGQEEAHRPSQEEGCPQEEGRSQEEEGPQEGAFCPGRIGPSHHFVSSNK